MRHMLGSILFILVTTFIQPVSAADARTAAAVRIRIYNYAKIRDAPLARAQRMVTVMYDAIGVRTEWLEPIHSLDGAAGMESAQTDLTIIVLTPKMAARRKMPDGVVGYAAVTRGQAGRFAFVIYDRVRAIARMALADDMRVMGMVMAHELGHLLLPHELHSDEGLMRGHWAAADFSRLDLLDLRFSRSQAEEIRQTLAVSSRTAP